MDLKRKDGIIYKKVGSYKPSSSATSVYSNGTNTADTSSAISPLKNTQYLVKSNTNKIKNYEKHNH